MRLKIIRFVFGDAVDSCLLSIYRQLRLAASNIMYRWYFTRNALESRSSNVSVSFS